LVAAFQLSETPRDENAPSFHDPPDFPPEILVDTIFIIAVDPLYITADVLDDAALVLFPCVY
jgi:hypothetical protein